ncbi:MAG: sel1 repeat family protein [Clostridia bacterium]|nr:sel1 repeat family protein [Clostridia bacterium]
MAYNQKTVVNTEERGGMMICTEETCGRSIEEPLELFDGSLVCPYCGNILKHKFSVNERNDNLFRLSQAYYFKYLAAAATLSDQTENEAKKAERIYKYLESAVAYCREAARSGHPEACVKLGFYWEVGYVRKRDSIDRYKMAYRYYDEVCNLDEKAIEIERGEGGVVTARDYAKSEKFRQVKTEAAARLLKMLAEVGEELHNIMGFNLAAVTDRAKAIAGEQGESNVSLRKASREEIVLRTLKEAKKNAGDAPVFGYFLMSASALREAYGDEKTTDKIFNLVSSGGKLELKWVFWTDLDDNDVDNNAFVDINDNQDSLPEERYGEKQVLVSFFNGAWSPAPQKVIGKKKTKCLNKLSALLFKYNDPTESFHELCKTSRTEFARIFYADDLYYGCLKDARDPIRGILEHILQKRAEGDN